MLLHAYRERLNRVCPNLILFQSVSYFTMFAIFFLLWFLPHFYFSVFNIYSSVLSWNQMQWLFHSACCVLPRAELQFHMMLSPVIFCSVVAVHFSKQEPTRR